MREGRGIRAEHIAGHQRHRTERHRPAETSPQPVSWLMVPERDQGMRAPESHYFVAMPAAGCAVCGSCWQMDEIAGLIMEAGRKASGRSQLISSKPVSRYLHCFRHSPEIYLIAGASRVLGLHRQIQIGRPLRLAIYRQLGCSFCRVPLKQA